MAGPDSYAGTFPGTLAFDGHRIECLVTVYGTLCDSLDVWVPSGDRAHVTLYRGGGTPPLAQILLS